MQDNGSPDSRQQEPRLWLPADAPTTIGRELGPAGFLIFGALATRARNDTGLAFPSVPTLASDTGLSRRSVLRALTVLEGAGWISVDRTEGRVNRYRVNRRTSAKKDTGTSAKKDTGPVPKAHPELGKRTKNKELGKRTTSPDSRPDAPDRDLAEWFWSLILEMQPNRKPPDLAKWANTIRLMRERDGRTDADIRDLFQRVNGDDFWQTNILSPEKLRAKWDDLDLRLRRSRNGNGRNRRKPSPGERYDPAYTGGGDI